MKCPKCGSTDIGTYRHINAEVWCENCSFVLRNEGNSEYNTVDIDRNPYKMNKELAKSKGISLERQQAIQQIGNDLMTFLNHHDKWVDNDQVYDIIRGYEFVLQRMWGFPYDSNFHRYQLSAKLCTCKNMMDNLPCIDGGPFWIDIDCPIHGKGLNESE